MWPDRVSNQGPLTYESGILPTALRGSAHTLVNKPLEYPFCVLNFAFCFLLKRNVLGGNLVRFKYNKYERYKSLIASIYFLYTLPALFFYIQTGPTFLTELPSSILTDFLLLFTASW